MLITNHPQEKDSMSPFPFRKRAFTDTTKDGSDIIIGAGATTATILKKLYEPSKLSILEAEYAFLTRDNKEKKYDPGKEDPFVFKNAASINDFKKEALRIIKELTKIWQVLDLPTELDKDRGLTLPSSDKLMKMLESGQNQTLSKFVSHYYDIISLILSNIDIAKKFCIVRSVFPGWWLGSYAGKEESRYDYFKVSVEVHAEAFRRISATNEFKNIRAQMFADMGDPLISNVGYPFYSSGISAKAKVLATFQGTGYGHNKPYDQSTQWLSLKEKIVNATPDRGLQQFPFAVGVIRRQQYGYKWAHVMKQTEFGSISVDDVRGFNTVRIAFLFPYLYNLHLTPLVSDLNAYRYLLPGCYHDGKQKENRMKMIRNKRMFLMEADYSNYDRFQLLDMMTRMVYLSYKGHPGLESHILPMFVNTYRNIPLLLPDYNGAGKSVGIAITVPKVGLLSGGKHTSTNGTIHNSIVNIAGFINHNLMSRNEALDYLLQYLGTPQDTIGGGNEWSHMMSDDTLLMDTSISGLLKKGAAFKDAADTAGLKSSLGIGDRFLMRHTYEGKDTPVLARIWQNTLSNESPPDHELKFLVGLATRTEGVLGQKTVDPFSLGKNRKVPVLEAYLTHLFLSSLRSFMAGAATPSRNAIEYLDVLIGESKRMSSTFKLDDPSSYTRLVELSSEASNTLDRYRNAFTKALATYELQRMSTSEDVLNTYIAELASQVNVPSSKYMLEQITAMNSDIARLVSDVGEREHAFFLKALETIGINKQF